MANASNGNGQRAGNGHGSPTSGNAKGASPPATGGMKTYRDARPASQRAAMSAIVLCCFSKLSLAAAASL
jgi:hypothetical protein